jgi:hypothetical protein
VKKIEKKEKTLNFEDDNEIKDVDKKNDNEIDGKKYQIKNLLLIFL